MNDRQKQWQLFFLGYYGDSTKNIDGIFGPKSEAATLQFQKEFFSDPIAHDGIFGSSTEAKSMEVVDRIQDILKSVVPNLVDDGLAGPKTMEAMKLYQESHLLPATGRVDDATWELRMLEIPRQEATVEPVPESDTGCKEVVVSKNETTTGTFWDGIRYFKREEFRCKCGGRYCNGFPAEPKRQLLELLDAAREHFGRPAHIVSGLRDPEWNRIQGGVANSQHMYGEAADVRIDGVSSGDLLSFFQSQPGVRYTYAINGTNVHVDIPKGAR